MWSDYLVGKFFIFIIKSIWSVIIWCLASKVAWWALIISMLSLLPAISGSELGFRRWYIRFLVDLFDWATNRLDAREDNEYEELEEEEKEDPIRKFSAATSLEKPTLRDPLGEFQIIEVSNYRKTKFLPKSRKTTKIFNNGKT